MKDTIRFLVNFFDKIWLVYYARSSNGRTIDSESIYPRSNRGWATRERSVTKTTVTD